MIKMRKTIGAGGIALAVLGVAACGTTRTVQVVKDVPGPTVTVTTLGPTVTTTVTVTAQPSALTTKTFNGSGQWNSPEFTLNCDTPAVLVKYQFSGNSAGFGGSNFIAALKSPSGDQQLIANAIAASGGTTTTVYPNAQLAGDGLYYLSVMAAGNWSFTLIETC